MKNTGLILFSARPCALLAALLLAAPLFSQDDVLKSLMGATEADEPAILEQLKSARAMMTAELWKNMNDPLQPGAKERDSEAEAKAQAKGIAFLDEIEALEPLGNAVRIELYQLRQLQYTSIQSDYVKFEEYSNKLLKLPNCPPALAAKVQDQIADLGSPWRVMEAFYVYCLPEDIINRWKAAFMASTLKKIAGTDFQKNPEIAGSYNALGQTYWKDGQNEEAEKLFIEVSGLSQKTERA